MKKVIDGKMYNTETAKEIADWDNGYNGSDFRCCSETLYRKKNREFFLYGDGGAMSKYSESYGNDTVGSSDITALSIDEVKDWLQEKQCIDAYEKLFGVIPE